MKGDLYINDKDAWLTWGVNMGEGFLDALDAFVPMKAFIENESRAEDGKRVVATAPKVASRDVTLHFTLTGNTQQSYRERRNAFEEELRGGFVNVRVPALGTQTYKLIYTGKNVSYAMNHSRTFSAISAKFEEVNPADR